MDVSIRASNMVLTFNLLRDFGYKFSLKFCKEVMAAILTHARFIFSNLEWNKVDRGNHYLSNIFGLIIIGTFLPESEETNLWLIFGIQELLQETRLLTLVGTAGVGKTHLDLFRACPLISRPVGENILQQDFPATRHGGH